jgi:hypothetical protein
MLHSHHSCTNPVTSHAQGKRKGRNCDYEKRDTSVICTIDTHVRLTAIDSISDVLVVGILFGHPIFRLWAYLMKVIPETHMYYI